MVKNLSAMQETQVRSLGQEDPLEDPLEEGMAIHSSILAWRIPWTEELGGLQSIGLQRIGHNWATNTSTTHWLFWLPESSVGKESVWNAGDPSSIPGLGRYAGEGIGYSLLYSWASLVAQLIKNLFTVWETWAWSLGWKDPLEKGTPTHSSTLPWRIP